MKLDFFIAKKFLLSLRKIKIIHLINIVTLAGITIGSAALILSSGVYNGLEGLVMETLKTVDPDMKIRMSDEKFFEAGLLPYDELKSLKGIEAISEILEAKALLLHGGHSVLAHMKGMNYTHGQENYLSKFVLQKPIDDGGSNDNDSATIGAGLAFSLNLTHRGLAVQVVSSADIMSLGKSTQIANTNTLARNFILVNKIFSIDKQHDEKYIITPLKFAQQVVGVGEVVSYVGLYVKPGYDLGFLKKKIENILASRKFTVCTLDEQESTLLRAIRTEKTFTKAIFIIILLIATLNVLFSTMMFLLIKRKDLATLSNLGMLPSTIQRITAMVGLILALVGASMGAVLALSLEWLQKTYKIISLGENVAIVDAYPIDIRLQDVVYTFLAVVISTLLATFLPMRKRGHDTNA